MPSYQAPVSDTVFLLSDVFDYAKYANSPAFPRRRSMLSRRF